MQKRPLLVATLLSKWVAIFVLPACGGSTTLDLGHSAPPWYATPETIAAEDNAPPGVPTVIATHQQAAGAIAVDDERIYWSIVPIGRRRIQPLLVGGSRERRGENLRATRL